MNRGKTRKLLPAVALAAALVACQGKAPQDEAASISIDSLLTVAEACVGDTLTVRGVVMAITDSATIYMADAECGSKVRVNASEMGDIEPGDAIVAHGILSEARTSIEAINRKEALVDSLYREGRITSRELQKASNALAAKRAYMELTDRGYCPEFFLTEARVSAE